MSNEKITIWPRDMRQFVKKNDYYPPIPLRQQMPFAPDWFVQGEIAVHLVGHRLSKRDNWFREQAGQERRIVVGGTERWEVIFFGSRWPVTFNNKTEAMLLLQHLDFQREQYIMQTQYTQYGQIYGKVLRAFFNNQLPSYEPTLTEPPE